MLKVSKCTKMLLRLWWKNTRNQLFSKVNSVQYAISQQMYKSILTLRVKRRCQDILPGEGINKFLSLHTTSVFANRTKRMPATVMASSNGNIFCVTGLLCGEFTGHRWITFTNASDAELWYLSLICPWINGWGNNRDAGNLRRHHAHYDVIVMITSLRTWTPSQRLIEIRHMNNRLHQLFSKVYNYSSMLLMN